MYICVNVISYILIPYEEVNLLKYNVSEWSIMHYVLTTILDRLYVIVDNFFWVLQISYKFNLKNIYYY